MDDSNDPSGASGYRHLRVWQEAMQLTALRPVCTALEGARRWPLADQLARAATSVHANIAEGNGRSTRKDRVRVFTIAWSSLLEVEALLDEAGLEPAVVPLLTPCTTHVRRTARLLAALRRALRD